ncbi:alkaline phytoceramidase [Arthroderma uncinatum]|uniref:alkaline phytoceramidase n=1 Tax=Arthroderma uncinatum TaxID=74035 RepID=UPI00144A8755|nr:alkaline phytoceramidase [Arthroderma uncinatum]KAF3480248.1 alkaline phytoceramidase [Arthroderma uncinatum]
MHFHIPYPPAKAGFWSPVTSTLNWCEEDYYATPYAAEIVNALTNVLFLYLGIKGIRSCRKNGHDPIFQIAFLGYLLVGSGSFLFHSTLKYPMQLVDELSMIYTTCLMCYATFSFSKSRTQCFILGAGLLGLSIFITLYYHYIQDPVFHQVAYAVLTAIVVFRSMWVMEVTLRPSFQRSRNQNKPHPSIPTITVNGETLDERDIRILKSMWAMVAYGLSTFLGGFVIWNLDNEYCSTLRGWRREIGLPWGILLEGHGWWHVLTGIGAYMYITWGIWLRHCLHGRRDEYKLHWPRFYNAADIVRVQDTPKSTVNGGYEEKIN